MSDHTPGPWEVFGASGIFPKRYPGIDSKSLSIVVFGANEESDQGIQGKTLEEAQANARLIAAAPDLLEALKLVNLHFQRNHSSGNFQGDDEHETWTAVRAAIAKTEGAVTA